MRVTQQLMTHEMISLTAKNLERLTELQGQAASGKRLRLPQDDPAGAGRASSLRGTLNANETYLQNIAAGKEWLNATEAALTNVSDVMRRALTAAARGGSDTNGANERLVLGNQVDGLLSEALTQFNTRHREAYLFAGFRLNTIPFTTTGTPVTSFTYNGDANSRLMEIAPQQTVAINVSGSGSMASNVLQSLIDLRDHLQANQVNLVNADIATLQTAFGGVSDTLAEIGARQQRLTDMRSQIERVQLGLQEFLSRTEDANMPEVLMRLSEQEAVYQASLNSAAKLTRANLFDYLK
ncbi:MAG: flagellar hook-associated protein FlgL [Chloroflexota bacterium]